MPVLAVIATRSEALSRFMGAYARLAKLPRPAVRPVHVRKLVEQVIGLETRVKPALYPGPEMVFNDLLGIGLDLRSDDHGRNAFFQGLVHLGRHMQELKNRGDELPVTDFRITPDAFKLRRIDRRRCGNDHFFFHDNGMENVGLIGFLA